jgi:hypothetical protein
VSGREGGRYPNSPVADRMWKLCVEGDYGLESAAGIGRGERAEANVEGEGRRRSSNVTTRYNRKYAHDKRNIDSHLKRLIVDLGRFMGGAVNGNRPTNRQTQAAQSGGPTYFQQHFCSHEGTMY